MSQKLAHEQLAIRAGALLRARSEVRARPVNRNEDISPDRCSVVNSHSHRVASHITGGLKVQEVTQF